MLPVEIIRITRYPIILDREQAWKLTFSKLTYDNYTIQWGALKSSGTETSKPIRIYFKCNQFSTISSR